jgi:hypothetical protein
MPVVVVDEDAVVVATAADAMVRGTKAVEAAMLAEESRLLAWK